MQKRRILIVEDEPDVLKVIAFRVKKLGHEIVVAVDGQEAIDLIQEKKPDLVLLDLLLPVIDGYEVCRRIKSDEQLKDICVILLTASTVGSIADKARELKADDYMIKPFNSDVLLAKIEKHLA